MFIGVRPAGPSNRRPFLSSFLAIAISVLSLAGCAGWTTGNNSQTSPPPSITSVSANNITATGVTISWTTNVPASSQVNYGTTAAYGSQSALNSTLVTSHSVSLSGLSASTLYHYQAVSVDASNSQVSSADFTFTTAGTTPVISGVSANNITATGVTISWTTNVPASSQVNYGTTAAYGSQSALNSTLVTSHSVSLSGLSASTLYHYQAVSVDAFNSQVSSGDFTFTTASGSSSSVPTLIQYANDSLQNNVAVRFWTKKLPNPTQAGNLLVMACTWASPAVGSVTDDKGNFWTAGPVAQDASIGQTLQIFYAQNVAAATQVVTMNLTSSAAFVQCTPHEFYNVSTGVNPTDGSSTAVITSGTELAAGNLTTTSDGDLIFYAGMCARCGNPGNPISFTAGSGFTATVADGTSFFGAQYQVQSTAGAINPAMSMSAATSGGFAASIAFKSASAGSAPTAGIHINSAQVLTYPLALNWTGSSITLQVPTTGNLIVIATESLTNADVTAVSSSPPNVWNKTGACANNSANAISVCIWYAANATPSPNMKITLTYNQFPVVGPIDGFWDISGAATSPFDVAATATGNLAQETGTISAPTLTPATANGVVIALMEQDSQTVGSASPGALMTVQTGGYQYLGLDQDGGWLSYYNPSTNPITFAWTFVNTEGAYNVGNWEAIAAAFKAAP